MSQSPSICQLLLSLTVGGAEVLAARIGRRLRDRYRFVYVCLDDLGVLGKQLQEEGFPVHVVGRRTGVDWRLAFRLARLLRGEGVDLIHAHQYTPFFYALTARLLYRRPPVLFMEHGRSYPDYPRRKRMIANRLLLQRRDRVVGVGAGVRQALIQNEGIPADRVQVIYNGIDVDHFAAAPQLRAEARAELGLVPQDFALLLVARLDPLKDLATAIRTVERVAQRHPSARLLLVGEGPERELVEGLVREKALASHVRLLGLRQDLPRLYAAADLFLLTSISEGIPVTVLEAMAAGLPVIATTVGGLPEIIDDGRTGLLAPARDEEALADQVLKLIANATQRQQLAHAGQAHVRAHFTEAQMHAGYERLYREMLHG